MTDFRFPIEAGHIMMFARAIGDTNPLYSEVKIAGTSGYRKIIAPPTFVQASAQFNPEYPLRPHPGRPWFASPRPSASAGSAREFRHAGPKAVADSMLSNISNITAQYRPGRFSRSEHGPGESWNKGGARGGSLAFSETITEYRDREGLIVVTARSVSVRTGQTIEGGN